MHISEHYPALVTPTLLVLTNNELAKLFVGHEREIRDFEVLTTPEIEPLERISGTHVSGTPNLDAAKQHRRDELYAALSKRLHVLLQEGVYEEIILCVPEANKNELLQTLHPEIAKRLQSLVPKNLASMDLGQVLRILFET